MGTCWLLGAGFSRPLGGPLFSDLLDEPMRRWVRAWLELNGLGQQYPTAGLQIYDSGHAMGLWKNAEDCISFLSDARLDKVAAKVLDHHFQGGAGIRAEQYWSQLSQFVAAATSFFVERAEGADPIPEVWLPYQDWFGLLPKEDFVVSFNYDRVVQVLRSMSRAAEGPALAKLHGTVPEKSDLLQGIRKEQPISEIATPGSEKAASVRQQMTNAWALAKRALSESDRLVVIGYSFPASDPSVRSFVSRHCHAGEVVVVLGSGSDGADVAAMFKRVFPGIAVDNTLLQSQQFLAEGTAQPDADRFSYQLRNGGA